MKRIDFLPKATQNLIKSFPLLLSTVAALCLFLSRSLISLLMIAAIFMTVAITAILNQARPPVVSNRLVRLIAVLITMLIEFMGYDAFKTAWMPSSIVAVLANTLHLTTQTLLLIVGLVGCVVGFYALYTLSCWIVIWVTQLFKERLREQRKAEIIANLYRNWYFPISAMAFFCLNATLTLEYFIGLLIAFVASLVVASQIPSLFAFAKQNRIQLHVIAVLTALGICWFAQSSFYAKAMVSIDIIGVVSVSLAVAAVPFIYFCVLAFWKEMVKIISDNGMFGGINATERVVYSVLIIASLAFMAVSFAQTRAFYRGTDNVVVDIIYTSDSPNLVQGNVYLALTHSENDLRQPLFAVFAAPFAGIPYLFGKLFGASASVQAMLVNMVQIIMLFVANFMLAKMMRLNPNTRVCFMVLTSCTYTHLLFALMMEQYIVAYFWLVFCMWQISEKQSPDRIVLWGAGGTLLTSMVLLPFMSNKNPVRNFKEWFADMVKYGLEFVTVMLVFCRFDVIFNLTSKISSLSHFTGKTVTFADKIYQYVAFVSNCFIAPDAGANTTVHSHISWQLNPVTSINFRGVVILLLVVISAVLNRDKKSSLLAAGWAAFSAVMFLGLGWGTVENGLILYALYFGWAFLVLLFQLVEKIENKLNVKFLVPVLSAGCAVVLTIVNIPAIMEMVNFAITYFPV